MLKYFIPILFTTSLFASQNVEKFVYEDHEYLHFVDCKAVLHNPDCHKCRFTRWVTYSFADSTKYQIVERLDISPFRWDFPQ